MRNIYKQRNFSAEQSRIILFAILKDGQVLILNIHGLVQIRFPKNNLSSKFEKIRQVFERENVIE